MPQIRSAIAVARSEMAKTITPRERHFLDAIDKLKGGQKIEQVLGWIAFEYGREARTELEEDLRKAIIRGAE
jgi:hypothetical protein